MSDSESTVKPDVKPTPDAGNQVNIKVSDSQTEVFFKVKKTTMLKKVIDAFCKRAGKDPKAMRFLFEGERVTDKDTPESLGIQEGDALEAHNEQLGGLTCT